MLRKYLHQITNYQNALLAEYGKKDEKRNSRERYEEERNGAKRLPFNLSI